MSSLSVSRVMLLAVALCTASLCYALDTDPMVVSYLKLPGYEIHYAYRYELIHQIMEVTREDFGDYRLAPYTEQTTNKRYAQLLVEGNRLNLLWASPGTPVADAGAIAIPGEILRGLLGYRVCLVNSQQHSDLGRIKTLKDLSRLKIGQGIWPDRNVYQYNHISTIEAPNFENLFLMLEAGRFDCIALGADEVVDIYNAKKKDYPFLAIDNHLLIYYHYPLYFYVSKKSPRLAERMQKGFQRLQANGEFYRLFNQYHAQSLQQLQLSKRQVVCMNSPYINTNDCAKPLQYPDAPYPSDNP